jgi:hypothetical protein
VRDHRARIELSRTMSRRSLVPPVLVVPLAFTAVHPGALRLDGARPATWVDCE